jgi:alkylated DNA repair dioxygenase AlkB
MNHLSIISSSSSSTITSLKPSSITTTTPANFVNKLNNPLPLSIHNNISSTITTNPTTPIIYNKPTIRKIDPFNPSLLIISGQTYNIRSEIKAVGGLWNSIEKYWTLKSINLNNIRARFNILNITYIDENNNSTHTLQQQPQPQQSNQQTPLNLINQQPQPQHSNQQPLLTSHSSQPQHPHLLTPQQTQSQQQPNQLPNIIINDNNCKITLFNNFISNPDDLFKSLSLLPFKYEKLFINNTITTASRKTCSFADTTNHQYEYGGYIKTPNQWEPNTLLLKSLLEENLNIHFNFALLNLYPNGNISIGAHSDDEKDILPNSPIATFSLGATRNFLLINKLNKQQTNISLSNGSLLLMEGKTQQLYTHAITKDSSILNPRISITYRIIIPKNSIIYNNNLNNNNNNNKNLNINNNNNNNNNKNIYFNDNSKLKTINDNRVMKNNNSINNDNSKLNSINANENLTFTIINNNFNPKTNITKETLNFNHKFTITNTNSPPLYDKDILNFNHKFIISNTDSLTNNKSNNNISNNNNNISINNSNNDENNNVKYNNVHTHNQKREIEINTLSLSNNNSNSNINISNNYNSNSNINSLMYNNTPTHNQQREIEMNTLSINKKEEQQQKIEIQIINFNQLWIKSKNSIEIINIQNNINRLNNKLQRLNNEIKTHYNNINNINKKLNNFSKTSNNNP